jgi:signal transduction histidine kinase
MDSATPVARRPGAAGAHRSSLRRPPASGTARQVQIAARPARAALERVFAFFPAIIRLSCGIAVAVVALAVQTPPVALVPLAVTAGVLTVWSVVFFRRTVRHGISAAIVAVDLVLTGAACVLMPYLIAPELLPGGVSWLAVLASTSVIVSQFALPWTAGIPAGLLVAAAYAFGAYDAGDPNEAVVHAAVLALQTGLAAGLVYLTRRSSRAADRVFVDYQRTERDAVIARAAREAERQQNRDLHDTVLSTLTMVGLGGAVRSTSLRARAGEDLETLVPTRPSAAFVDPTGRVQLDERLRTVVARLADPPVVPSLTACAVPVAVANAFGEAAAAALSNVARHAPGITAWLRLRQAGATVVVEVVDAGPGFETYAVPGHRYGIRESIVGRMAAVGGTAEVDSAPGRGTWVRLKWIDAVEEVRGPAGTVGTTAERGGRLAAAGIAFGWHFAVNLPALIANWHTFHEPWAAGAGWLLYLAVGLVAGARMFGGVPVPAWPLITVLLLVDVLIFAITPGDYLFFNGNWAWGTIGWFAVLVLWGRRVWALVGVLAAGAVVAFVGVLASGPSIADLSRFVMFVYGTSVLPIVLVVAVNALRASAAEAAATAAAQAAVEAERLGAVRAQRERRERLSLAAEAAREVLTGLASGRLDPGDPEVQRQCAVAAARLRRLIAESDDVPDPLLHELRACVDVAERHGLPVELIAVGELPRLPVSVRRRLAEPLAAMLTGAQDWARITVVARDTEVVVSLTTPAADEPDAVPASDPSWPADGVVDYWYERDEDLVWTQTRWRAAA